MSPPTQHATTVQQALDRACQHHNAGRLPEAESAYRQILKDHPDNPVALHLMGVLAHQVGRNDVAVDFIAKALAIMPGFAEAHANMGAVLKGLGRLDDAVESYLKALALKPDFTAVWYNLGNTYRDLGRLDDAVASYGKALATNPGYAEAHSNMGAVLTSLGRLEEAAASYRKAIAAVPGFADAHSNLGNVLGDLGKLDEAVASYNRAIAINPDVAVTHSNLGLILGKLGKFEDAQVSHNRAISISPENAKAFSNRGKTLMDQGRADEAVSCFRKAIAIEPDDTLAHNNLLMTEQYRFCDLSQTFADACRYGEIVTRNARPVANHANSPDPERRLRVGLVSGDFYNHPVGFFLNGIFSEIDAASVELYAYSISPFEDELTAKFKSQVSKWQQVVGVSEPQLANIICADGIDILVDLSGHSAGSRLPLFAWKPAPVQVTWIGSNVTTGIREIDYILCDPWTLPPAEEKYFVEKPWRLPDTWLCFTPPELDLKEGPLPALENGFITFGCFNNLIKMNDVVVKVWSEILKAAPDSKLFLKTRQMDSAPVCENTFRRFENNGIPRDRIILEGHSARADLLAAYQKIDVALDPFPFPGGISSMEALWMGVPVLSVKGERFVSHVAESTLHNVGLSNWISESPQDLAPKAVSMTSDLAVMTELRTTLRQRLLASPLCDNQAFAAHLNNAFRDMWRIWCDQAHG